MFGKPSAEEKAAMRKKFQNMLAEGSFPSASPAQPVEEASDAESLEGSTEVERAPHQESIDGAAEVLRIHTGSKEVEITNMRLFHMDELDLHKLTDCEWLSLRKNLIHELSPLPLPLAQRLKELDFFDNKIKKIGDFFQSAMVSEEETPESENNSDVVPLVKRSIAQPFCALTKLDLSYNQLRHVNGLESLAPTLTELYLVENKLKVIEGLDALTNLQLLELGGNRLRDIGTGLEKLVNLKQLWLGKNKIVNIGTSLLTLGSLELLSLQANRILAVGAESFPAGVHTNLKELYLSENGITTIENLEHLHSLRTLDFSFNPIARINEEVINATTLPLLHEFWLTDGKIDSWDEVGKFACFSETLRTVYLERNPIEQDKRYRDKVYMFLPFVTQIDSWPVLNKGNLEADRTIQRKNARD